MILFLSVKSHKLIFGIKEDQIEKTLSRSWQIWLAIFHQLKDNINKIRNQITSTNQFLIVSRILWTQAGCDNITTSIFLLSTGDCAVLVYSSSYDSFTRPNNCQLLHHPNSIIGLTLETLSNTSQQILIWRLITVSDDHSVTRNCFFNLWFFLDAGLLLDVELVLLQVTKTLRWYWFWLYSSVPLSAMLHPLVNTGEVFCVHHNIITLKHLLTPTPCSSNQISPTTLRTFLLHFCVHCWIVDSTSLLHSKY